MKKINILGFGSGNKGEITLETIDILKKSDMVFVRTMRHPSSVILEEYGINYIAFDSIYDNSESFEDVYLTIAKKVVESDYDIVSYIVPGSAVFAEKAVTLICQMAKCEVSIIPSVSFIDAMFSSLKTDASKGFKLTDALRLDEVSVDPDSDNIICQVYDRFIASDVKLKLMEIYPDDTKVYLINSACTEDEVIHECELFEIDRFEDIDHLTSLFIPKLDSYTPTGSFSSINNITRLLQSKDGCPWDSRQTYQSLSRYVLEEAYEVVDAIEKDDPVSISDELGDLLFLIILLSHIADSMYDFTINDVIKNISEKMVRRHPNVFKDNIYLKNDLDDWEKTKESEENFKYSYEKLEKITNVLPSLQYALKIQEKAALKGYDILSDDEILSKIETKLSNLKDSDNKEKELNDILFYLVSYARRNEIDTEITLKNKCKEFISGYKENELSGSITDDMIEKTWEK